MTGADWAFIPGSFCGTYAHARSARPLEWRDNYVNQEPEPTEQQIKRLIEHRRFVEKQKSLLAEEARNKDLLPQTSLMYTSSYLFDILKEFPDLFKGFNAQIFLSPSGGLRAPQVFTYLDTVLHQIDERITWLFGPTCRPSGAGIPLKGVPSDGLQT